LVFTLSANSKADDADKLRDQLNDLGGCSQDGTAPANDCKDLNDQRKSVDSSRNIAIGAFVVGGVAAVAAGYFYWDALAHGSSRSAKSTPTRPAVAVTPSFDVKRNSDEHPSLGAFKLTVSGTF
jgi:hypothetical protein